MFPLMFEEESRNCRSVNLNVRFFSPGKMTSTTPEMLFLVITIALVAYLLATAFIFTGKCVVFFRDMRPL